MAEIIINDVKYTNVPNKKAGTKFASALTQSNIGMSQAVQDYVNSSYFYALINAIDINWDGIDIGENTYINTTSDLIKWIESKAGDIDLSSYATVSYVNQKFEDLIGGAPETLDTLKELADALQEDASLAYVTQALDGKADKATLNSYATINQLTNGLNNKANTWDVYDRENINLMFADLVNSYATIAYVTTGLNSKADIGDIPDMNDYATVSYVTSELDKKADLSDIPSAPDLTPYVTYTDANSYYVAKGDIPDMNDYATVSYVTSELDKKADLSDIPSAPDLTPYVTYTDANSYYVDINSYNALVARVEELASWIVSYHTPVIQDVSLWHTTDGSDTASYMSNNGGETLTLDISDSATHTINFDSNVNDIVMSVDGISTGITVNNTTWPYSIQYTPSMMTEGGNYSFGFSRNMDSSYNAFSSSFGFNVESSTPDPTPTPTQASGYWTAMGMEYIGTFDITTEDMGVSLDFEGTPDNSSWTFTDPNVSGITVNSNSGDIFIEPSVAGEGTYYVTAYYPGDSSYSSTSITLTITVTESYSPPKQSSSASWSNTSGGTEVTVVAGDTNTVTCTFSGTPESGWSFNDPVITGITVNTTTGDVSIDPTNMASGTYYVDATYPEDSSYNEGYVQLLIRVLPSGSNPNFYYYPDSMTIYNDGTSLSGNLVNNLSDPQNIQISYSSSDSSIASVDNSGLVTWVSGGSATITAAAFLISPQTPKLVAKATLYVTCEVQKTNPSASWSNTSGGTEVTVVAGDTNTVTCTFNGTPSSGWSIKSDPMVSGISIDSNTKNVTIDPTNMMSGTYYVDIEYYEDSSYYYGYGQLLIRVLPSGTNPNFYIWPDNITIQSGMNEHANLHNNLTPGDYVTILWGSSDTNVATVDSSGYVTWVSGGSATITVTAYGLGAVVVATATCNVSCEVQKSSPSASWSNTSGGTEVTVVAGDTNTVTCTFNSTPESGWSFNDPVITGITVNTTTGDVSIDPTNMASGTYNVDATYNEDSSYYYGYGQLVIRVLPSGTNPNFYYYPDSITIQSDMPNSGTLYNQLSDFGHCEYTSADTGIATVDSTGMVSFVSSGNTTVTATAYDSNNNVLATATLSVFCEVQKTTPEGIWSNLSSLGKCIVVAGDTNTVTCTFSGTPASGWTFNDPMITGITVDATNYTVTIDPTNMMSGTYHVYAEYPEDSSYNYNNMELLIRVLPSGSDVNFFFENDSYSLDNSMNQSMDINIETTISNTISWSSSDTGVCSIAASSMSWNVATITYVSDGSATLTATIDDNGTTRTATCTVTCSSMTP